MSYRSQVLETPGLCDFVSGIIFHEETLEQEIHGQAVPKYCQDQNILIGLKVDRGLAPYPGFNTEQYTVGIEDLDDRLKRWSRAGVLFTKWRSVFPVRVDEMNKTLLSPQVIWEKNIGDLTRFAELSQKHGMVPIVEPEVLFEGEHLLENTRETMEHVLEKLFFTLKTSEILLPGLILKTSMALPGKDGVEKASATLIGKTTATCLQAFVPPTTGGIVFLSGGQSSEDAIIHLRSIVSHRPFPWPVTASFSRAVQDPLLTYWTHLDQSKQRLSPSEKVQFHDVLLTQLQSIQDALSAHH
jgi:fructose-bisphosphate aldolase class I